MIADTGNIITGIIILLLNLIPFLTKKTKYYGVTLPLSVLIAVIKILFVP